MFTKSFGSLDARRTNLPFCAFISQNLLFLSSHFFTSLDSPHSPNPLTASHLLSWSITPSHRRNALETRMATSSLGVMFTKSMFDKIYNFSPIKANQYFQVNRATLDDHPKNQDPLAREEMLDTIMPAHEHGLGHQQSARTPMSPSSVGYSHSNSRMRRKHTACPSHHRHPVLTTNGSKQRRSLPNAYSTDTKTRTTSGR